MKRTIFTFAIVWGLSLGLWAQEDPEFANPEPDSTVDATKPVSLDTFTGQSLQFFETLKVDGYYIGGWKDSGEEVNTPVNALNFGFGSDVRLDRTARAYASFYLAYPKRNSTPTTPTNKLYNPIETPVSTTPSDNLDFDSLKIKELFLDYSLGNLAIVRLGRQTATWGQGRIFNPGNLIEGIGDGMAVKVSTAIGPVALTGVVLKNDNAYGVSDYKDQVSIASIGSALLAEYSSEWFSTGLSGFYHANIGEKADAYFKTSFLGADLFAEGLGEWGQLNQQSYTGLLGLYREFGEKTKWLKVQAEWLVSGQGSDGSFKKVSTKNHGFNDQTVGFAATSDFFGFLSTKPSVLWLHSLADQSGQLVFGFTNTSLPHIDLTLGLAKIYGPVDGRYVVNNPDTEKRTLSLTVKASFNFDIKS